MAPAGESSSSRAMDIPSQPSASAASSSTYPYNRRRRGQYSKIPSPVPPADTHAGPSSSSLSSDASWSSQSRPTTSSRPVTRIGQELKDPRLPTRLPSYTSPGISISTPQRKDKAPLRPSTSTISHSTHLPPLFPPSLSPLSPSMLASSSYTSVNLNEHSDSYSSASYGSDPSSPPRLITYTKHSQGFTWNDELFLPSYLLGRMGAGGYGSRGRRKQHDGDFGDEDVQVVDVFVTDEEAAAMMP